MLHWHPKYALWIKPDGTIRFTNLFTMSRNALKLPRNTTTETRSTSPPPRLFGIVHRLQLHWRERPASDSFSARWHDRRKLDPHRSGNWKYTTTPGGDAEDEGTISSPTSTSAVLTSSNTSREPTPRERSRVGNLHLPDQCGNWDRVPGISPDHFRTRRCPPAEP